MDNQQDVIDGVIQWEVSLPQGQRANKPSQ